MPQDTPEELNTSPVDESMLEVLLQNQDENAKSNDSLLENILQQMDNTNPEPLLEAGIKQSIDNTDKIVSAIKDKPETQKVEIVTNPNELAQHFFSMLRGEKGEKGDKGDSIRGEQGLKGEKGDSIRGEQGVKGDKGDQGEIGIPGMDGLDGKTGKPGKDGKDGKDGSPDKPSDIVNKLESLKGDKRLDFSAIKGLEKLLKTSNNLQSEHVFMGGGGVWGQITGDILAQTDLINYIATHGGGGTVTGTPTEIPYFDASGDLTSDADHTLLADGTLRLASTHGDVTGRFYQGDEPIVGNLHVWGKYAEDAVTGSLAADFFIEGTSSPDFGNDIALVRAGQFASTGTGYSETIYSGGLEKGIGLGTSGNFYVETVLDSGYKMYYSDEATSGGLLWANLQGMGILSQDWTSFSAGYPVDSFFGQVFADDTGTSTRVGTGKDIVDHVQVGTIISTVTFSGGGLDDFTPGGTYTGSFTGTYTVGCAGNDGARVVFNGGMTTGNEFNVGEVVTGSISGATAVVSNGTSDTRIWVYDVVGIFALGDILTGDQGNVSTAVTTGGGATGDLFQINYTDLTNQNIQWFTGNQASPVPFNGIGGITFAFASATGHMPNDNWSFTASANYSTRYVANDTSVSTGDVDDATTKTKQVIDITNQTISGWSDGANKNVLVGKELSLPDNTVTSVFEVALPAGAMTGGYFTATIIATDGTDLQAHSDHVTYAAVNKAGTMTASITASNGDDAVALSSGTLAITWTINTGTAGKITIEVTANSSLAAPTITLAGLNIDNNNGHVVTIL